MEMVILLATMSSRAHASTEAFMLLPNTTSGVCVGSRSSSEDATLAASWISIKCSGPWREASGGCLLVLTVAPCSRIHLLGGPGREMSEGCDWYQPSWQTPSPCCSDRHSTMYRSQKMSPVLCFFVIQLWHTAEPSGAQPAPGTNEGFMVAVGGLGSSEAAEATVFEQAVELDSALGRPMNC